jgi:hypothetical protein
MSDTEKPQDVVVEKKVEDKPKSTAEADITKYKVPALPPLLKGRHRR